MALRSSTYQDFRAPLPTPIPRPASRSEANFLMAIVAGGAAAVIGATVWAVITIAAGYQIGWIAIAVGLLVGSTIRAAGRGDSPAFSMAGAAFVLLGCALGNLFAGCGFIAAEKGVSLLAALPLLLDPSAVIGSIIALFSPIDLLFYGIAIYEGSRLSINADGPEPRHTCAYLGVRERRKLASGGWASTAHSHSGEARRLRA